MDCGIAVIPAYFIPSLSRLTRVLIRTEECLRGLLANEKVKPLIDRCYPFSETVEAVRYLEQGHARGKVVIRLENNKGS